jgi:transcriptional regulator with XRE-family HTH domain
VSLSPAEVSAHRHAMGLSLDQMAAMLGVNPRTVRSWESGRDRLSASSAAALLDLVGRHGELVGRMVADGVVASTWSIVQASRPLPSCARASPAAKPFTLFRMSSRDGWQSLQDTPHLTIRRTAFSFLLTPSRVDTERLPLACGPAAILSSASRKARKWSPSYSDSLRSPCMFAHWSAVALSKPQ